MIGWYFFSSPLSCHIDLGNNSHKRCRLQAGRRPDSITFLDHYIPQLTTGAFHPSLDISAVSGLMPNAKRRSDCSLVVHICDLKLKLVSILIPPCVFLVFLTHPSHIGLKKDFFSLLLYIFLSHTE